MHARIYYYSVSSLNLSPLRSIELVFFFFSLRSALCFLVRDHCATCAVSVGSRSRWVASLLTDITSAGCPSLLPSDLCQMPSGPRAFYLTILLKQRHSPRTTSVAIKLVSSFTARQSKRSNEGRRGSARRESLPKSHPGGGYLTKLPILDYGIIIQARHLSSLAGNEYKPIHEHDIATPAVNCLSFHQAVEKAEGHWCHPWLEAIVTAATKVACTHDLT